jgi:hypothetical protein
MQQHDPLGLGSAGSGAAKERRAIAANSERKVQ